MKKINGTVSFPKIYLAWLQQGLKHGLLVLGGQLHLAVDDLDLVLGGSGNVWLTD